MTVSQIKRKGDVYYTEIPAEEIEALGIRDGDIVKTEFRRIVVPPPDSENPSAPNHSDEQTQTERES